MFARHTPTRMKSSLAVQGLRALAAAIHGQLPLSPKESQRLLTAITTSFRKHLDDVHPPQAQDVEFKQRHGPSSLAKIDKQAMHSSTMLADSHMASILTGPLLSGKPGATVSRSLEYARREIDSGVNPLDVLETVQSQGDCDPKVSALCVRRYVEMNMKLPKGDQVPQLKSDRAGHRVLKWLLTSGKYKDAHFLDNEQEFRVDVVHLVMREGHEELLWEWLKRDEQIQVPMKYANSTLHWEKQRMVPYLWKGRILRSMVEEQLRAETTSRSAVPALDIFLRARAMQLKGRRARGHMAYLPLNPAQIALAKALQDHKGTAYNLPPDRFDDLLNALNSTASRTPRLDLECAILMLSHPSRADAQPLFEFMSRCTSEGGEDYEGNYTNLMAKFVRQNVPETQQLHLMLHGIALFRLKEQADYADDFLQLARSQHPESRDMFEPEIASKMRRLRSRGLLVVRNNAVDHEPTDAKRESQPAEMPSALDAGMQDTQPDCSISTEQELMEASREARKTVTPWFSIPGPA